MSRAAPSGSSTPTTRQPGAAFGFAPVSGQGVQRHPPVELQTMLRVRAWSLRLTTAAEAMHELAAVVQRACAEAGLVGPAGDALRRLAESVSAAGSTAARAAVAAADELDRLAAATLVTASADVVSTTGGPA